MDAAPAPVVESAPVATPTDAPAAAAATSAEEMIDLLLEEGKPPLRVPRSKLDPHLAKYRSETDKLRSEYDRKDKELGSRTAKIEAVLKAAKEDTDGALRELGVDPEEYAERKIAARVKRALQEAEEKADPAKKSARESDEERATLKKENEKLRKETAERTRAEGMQKIRNAIGAVTAKLPEQLREGAQAVVISVFRQALAAGKDITIEDAAKAARSVLIARAKAAYEGDEELRTLLGGKPAVVPPAPPPHPAAVPAPRNAAGKFAKADSEQGAGDVLLQIQRGKF